MLSRPENESDSMEGDNSRSGYENDYHIELMASPPVQYPQEQRDASHKGHHSSENVALHVLKSSDGNAINDDSGAGNDYTGLNEVSAPSPLENPGENREYQREFLEDGRYQEQVDERDAPQTYRGPQSRSDEADEIYSSETNPASSPRQRTSRLATQLYVVSYLILFSILGTLARLGLEALTTYPNSPLTISVLWANFGGSLIMGFLSEDRKIFTKHQGLVKHENDREERDDEAENAGVIEGSSLVGTQGSVSPEVENNSDTKKAHAALKKTIPLYIGLTTGFCGSFTSFSSFMRDCFLALSNEPLVSGSNNTTTTITSRNGGYSFTAVVAVIILTVSLCISSLQVGAHIAIAIEQVTPSIPVSLTRKVLDRSAVIIALFAWLATICIAIWPPGRASGLREQGNTNYIQDTWWSETIFSLIFAPVGCLLRFYASMHMNSIFAAFPLGTFVVNVSGTAVLGVSWDLQHAPLGLMGGSVIGSVIGCRVLQGIQDGFCGCLTTVSTWVLELTALKRNHAYFYGMFSIIIGLALLIVIMGSLKWSNGFSETACSAS